MEQEIEKVTPRPCHLTLPIAPHRLFVAANTEETERKFKDQPPRIGPGDQHSNRQTGGEYVYGVDDAELEFVDKHVSSNRPQTLLEKLRDRRRQKYAPH